MEDKFDILISLLKAEYKLTNNAPLTPLRLIKLMQACQDLDKENQDEYAQRVRENYDDLDHH